ncbi:MAG: cytochrome c oxidase assembly protein [Acidimicrobiales bacterium]|nr:cytochrome c oxidase assembly protein [Acidimicrobiales bacterium]
MGWWCSSTRQVWNWTPRPYLGALMIVGALIALGVWWVVRGRGRLGELEPAGHDVRSEVRGSTRGRTTAFVFGAIGLWAVLDWPLATLGAGYLASAQMIRQIVMVMAVAPLLLFACPPALAARVVGWGWRLRTLRFVATPYFAVPFAALSLIVVNSPTFTDPLLKSQFGSFAMDLVWVAAGFVLWMPVQCPHPGVRRLEGGPALVYLVGQSIIPVLPGFFMTWSDSPIYATYELAPRVFAGFTAVDDQTTAAAILQIGGMLFLWIQLSYRFISWAQRQMDANQAKVHSMARQSTSAS